MIACGRTHQRIWNKLLIWRLLYLVRVSLSQSPGREADPASVSVDIQGD